MSFIRNNKLFILVCMISLSVVSCSDDDNTKDNETPLIDDDNYIGKAVGNFSAEELYVGGEL